jgi:hypothetical protein
MNTRRSLLSLMALTLLAPAASAQDAATAPATAEAPLRIVINGIEGKFCQARTSPDADWQPAVVNMELQEGSELRTGFKSAIRFTILPDQVITIDRVTQVSIMRANFQDGKVITDLGMKYGRTRYDIDAEGRAHDAKVHSPSAVLAVRGTKFALYDQPPFNVQATSLSGRVLFRDAHKQVSFGAAGQGKTQIGEETDSAAGYALNQTVADPRGQFSGRSQTDNTLQLSLAAYGGSDFSQLGVLAFLDQARAGDFKGSLIGALPIGRQLSFILSWAGSPLSDLDLTVISPLGEIVSPITPQVASSGHHLGNGVADQSGFGSEQAVWEISYPVGDYTVRADLKSGQTADAQIFTIDDPLGTGQLISTISGTVTPRAPTLQGTVTATGQDQPTTSSRLSRAKPVKSAAKSPRPAATPRRAR